MEATNNNQGYVFLGNAPELMKLLEDIFTDEFMQQNTRFENFDGFKFSSAGRRIPSSMRPFCWTALSRRAPSFPTGTRWCAPPPACAITAAESGEGEA